MAAVIEHGAAHGWRSYLFGGSGVADEFADRLRSDNPDVQIVGCCSPPFHELSPAEDSELVDQINLAQPDIIWVGLGTPKQERWMASHREPIAAPVLIGVGAAFDFGAGKAPPSASVDAAFGLGMGFSARGRSLAGFGVAISATSPNFVVAWFVTLRR